jgi:phosphatidylserine/phosphatidylglycerophosphate/cardiolipin synthase-like enzyme
MLIDGELGYVGGAGITDDFDPLTANGEPWHEAMVEVRGPVLQDWHRLFADEWRKNADAPLGLAPPHAVPIAQAPSDPPRPSGQRGRVVSSGRLTGNDLSRSVFHRLRHARRRIWLATAYFVPSLKLRRALKRAAARGVDVRLLLPGPITDLPSARYAGRRFYARLLRHGARIFEYQPSFIHAKMLVCDDWVSVGSCNLDRWNMHWNLEANQEIDDPQFTEQATAMFTQDFARSTEWDFAHWSRRPWLARCAEWFWGRVDILLARLRRP